MVTPQLPAFVRLLFLSGFLGLIAAGAHAQSRPSSTVPEAGIRDRAPNVVAIVGADVVTAAGKPATPQTVIVRHGVIVAIGSDVDVPPDARQLDFTGKTIYPALIDAYSETKVPAPSSTGADWNAKSLPQRSVLSGWKRNAGEDRSFREAGFAIRLVAPSDGVLRGSSAVVTTSDQPAEQSVVKDRCAHHLRLTTRGGREQYPNSPMGAVALARQAFYDAQWYRDAWRTFQNGQQAPRPEQNDALAAIADAVQNDELFIMNAPDEQYVLRADRFAVEFQLQRVAVVASGREYQRLDAITQTGRTLIVPVNFSKAPNVATVEAAQNASLADLMHWYFAPENPARLAKAQVPMVLTSYGLKKRSEFRKQVIAAVEHGLDPHAALHACTLAPARLLGIEHAAGDLMVGKAANFMITDGDWLDKESKLLETWVDGQRFEHHHESGFEEVGTWKVKVQGKPGKSFRGRPLFLELSEDHGKLKGKAWRAKPKTKSHTAAEKATAETADESKRDGTDQDDQDDKKEEPPEHVKLEDLRAERGRWNAKFAAKLWDAKGAIHLTATVASDQTLYGELRDEEGRVHTFLAVPVKSRGSTVAPTEDGSEEEKPADTAKADEAAKESSESEQAIELVYPLGAFGASTERPQSQTVVFENATLWTCAGDGVVEGSLLVRDGKIVAVGREIEVPEGTLRVDVGGKHITPGIIDCHSHMATDGGINESTQAITAEVRIGDFIDATDIAIYRQLAGGVTTANVLHGSANPIGGQNQVIKLRWGQLPEDMKFAGAPAGIKFALGENVKQSNWGDDYRTRYPQSRLGVEQIMKDALLAAKEYERQWQLWHATGKGLPPRKDLELDTILQIVNRQRWIHCHSYRQDEILGLMRTLESFDIQIGTFQHILEGYKVAKEMAEHGAMGSAFSDWWGYKLEVYDAIPHNGALMHQAGIVVSFNSDDRELARHLNHEAAKAMKYGGVPAEEALKFVTINPAKQLRIESRVGSLEPGKDADLVVWSGDPLQITSRCEQTWIDGHRYFDRSEDVGKREADRKLHQRLVRHVLDSGGEMRKPGESNGLFRNLFPRHDEYCGHAHGHEHHNHAHGH